MEETPKQMDSIELYTGGAAEEQTITFYKAEIAAYTVIQLKEMLKNINPTKFPTRYQAIQEELNKKLASTGEQLQKKEKESQQEKPAEIETKPKKPIIIETPEEKQTKLDLQKLATIKLYFLLTIFLLTTSIYLLLLLVTDLPGKEIVLNLIELIK